MAQIPNLENAPLNLKTIRDKSQRELLNLLKNIHGHRCLVFDPKLSGSLSLIIQTSTLELVPGLLTYGLFMRKFVELKHRELGLELGHISEEPVQTESTKVIYLVRSQLSFMKFIASHIQHDILKAIQRDYYIYFVPCRSVSCEKFSDSCARKSAQPGYREGVSPVYGSTR